MKKILPALICALMLVGSNANARSASQHRAPVAAQPDEGQLIEHGHYTNKSGQTVHSPAHTNDGKVPRGATAKCRDGSYSFSQHRSGTCSGHHGVAAWL